METKQVIVVRKDLKGIGWGKLGAQIAHASVAAVVSNYIIDNGAVVWGYAPPVEAKHWLKNAFTKVCVWAEDEEELIKTYYLARDAGLPCSLIQDNGKTVFKGVPTYTTVGVGPGEVSEIDKITGHLKLI
jgi:PTH2 family peptidyl-tRNA hydrolase